MSKFTRPMNPSVILRDDINYIDVLFIFLKIMVDILLIEW